MSLGDTTFFESADNTGEHRIRIERGVAVMSFGRLHFESANNTGEHRIHIERGDTVMSLRRTTF